MSIYPSIRNAIFSAICDDYGLDETHQDDLSMATELTDKIMEALRRVEGDPLALTDGQADG